MKRKQKELEELKEECDKKQKRIQVLEQEIENHELESVYKKGGVLIFAGYDPRQAQLANKMYMRWKVEYDFHRSDRFGKGFDISNVTLVEESNMKYQFESNGLVVKYIEDDLSVDDDKDLHGCIGYKEYSSSTTGHTNLVVFRKKPWTKKEIEEYELSIEPDYSTLDEDDY